MHFIFISVSVVFGLRMWTVRSSVLTLLAVSVPTFLLMVRSIQMGTESRTELVEVPLMALLFLVMVWHVHKRQLAVEHERALFANASHELMTPLTIAWGELELLGRDGVAPTVEEFQETRGVVLEELHRGQVLAAGLLTLSRLDTSFSAQQSMTPADYLLDAAVRRWSRVTDRPLVIAARAGGELSCVRPDIGLLLDNLIENALRHTPGRLAGDTRRTRARPPPRARSERRGRGHPRRGAALRLRPLLPRTHGGRHARQRPRPRDREGDRRDPQGHGRRRERARRRHDVPRELPGFEAEPA